MTNTTTRIDRELPVLPNSGKRTVRRGNVTAERQRASIRKRRHPARSATDPLKSIRAKLLEGRIIEARGKIRSGKFGEHFPSGFDLGIEIAADKISENPHDTDGSRVPVAGSLPGEVAQKGNDSGSERTPRSSWCGIRVGQVDDCPKRALQMVFLMW